MFADSQSSSDGFSIHSLDSPRDQEIEKMELHTIDATTGETRTAFTTACLSLSEHQDTSMKHQELQE